jgi:hypothetical protein
MYATALGISALAFVLSRFSGNIVALVMKLIPVFAATAFLCVGLFNSLFSMSNSLYRFFRVFGVEAYICVAFAVATNTAAAVVVTREKKVDA